jgi:myo-inositol-1(or 4)-monophosphatase
MIENKYYTILKPIILRAGKKAKKDWQSFKRQDTEFKDKKELVTIVDKKTEKYLSESLRKALPDYGILGEEFGNDNKNSDYLWIIDPIDGTTNFSFHNPLWCISVGLAYKNKVIFGMIYIPVLDELYYANKGQGAYLNDKKIKIIDKAVTEKEIHAFCHGNSSRDVRLAMNYYRRQKLQSFDCRQLGSAAIELAYVAASRVDSLVIPGAKDWDIAAGALIAQEAGAKVTNFNGINWQLGEKDIIACRSKILNKILKLIK